MLPERHPPVNRSVLIAISIFALILLYFGVRSAMRGSVSSNHEEVVAVSASDSTEAIVVTVGSKPHPMTLEAKGRTAPDKVVTVKAGTAGNVVSTPVREGTFVKKGTLLCGLDIEARNARLKEAEAQRDAARIEFEAAQQLAAKGLAPANRELATKASLDAAEAGVNSARVEIGRTQIRAPFDGVFETRLAEAGDYLSPGAPCGVVVDLDPVIVSAEVTEAQAGRLKTGLEAMATLADGRTFPATLRYVARTASAETRTFQIEAELNAGDEIVAAGVTASLSVPLGEVAATNIPLSLLTLSDTGTLGVRFVSADQTVGFAPVQVIDEGPDGAWVTGLPETVSLIAMGQDYLNEGVKVTPVAGSGARP